jgi:phage terminase large subunit
MNIQIPYKFTPREYQIGLFKAMDSGYKRAIAVYHRRAGKDKSLLNIAIKKALERVGVYYYFFPEFAQGRRVIWDGIDGDGFRFLDHFPKQLVEGTSKQEMQIRLTNGSIIQIVGTDKYDKVRGSNPVGCVFSEYAFQNPGAWDVVRPILAENGGWAVFNSTPAGKNHFYKLYEMALTNPSWYTQLVTVDDSVDPVTNQRYVSEQAVQDEIDAGMSDEMVRQEFYCDFNVNVNGYYFLDYLVTAEEEGRIGKVPYDVGVPVDTWWDIGIGDSTAIWFTQTIKKEVHVIDFYQNNSVGLEHYAKALQERKYVYGSHNFPHDMEHTEFGTGRTRLEMAEDLFRGTRLNVVPKLPIEDGVNAVRMMLPKCHFDGEKCEKGLDALHNYHREFDDKLKEFKNKPVHDWSSHPADAFRYFALGYTQPRAQKSNTAIRMDRFKTLQSKGWMTA